MSEFILAHLLDDATTEVDTDKDEIALIARDLKVLREYEIRTSETIYRKKHQVNREHQLSPVLVHLLHQEDWTTYFDEVRRYGCSVGDKEALAQWICDHVNTRDIDPLVPLCKRLVLLDQSPSTSRHDDLSQYETIFVELLDKLAYNVDTSEIQTRLQKAFDAHLEGVITSVIKNRNSNDSDRVTVRNQVEDQERKRLNSEAKEAVTSTVSSKLSRISGALPSFPLLQSKLLSEVSSVGWSSQAVSLKETAKSLALKSISKRISVPESLEVLVHLDPDMAIAEATLPADRKLVSATIAKSYPDVFLDSHRHAAITAEDTVAGLNQLATHQPLFLLRHIEDIDCPETILSSLVKMAIKRVDVVSVIELSRSSDYISTICHNQDVSAYLQEKLDAFVDKGGSGSFIKLYFLYPEDLSKIAGPDKYRKQVLEHINLECQLYLAALSRFGDVRDPVFISALADFSDSSAAVTGFRKTSHNFFSRYPQEIQVMMQTMAMIRQDQSLGVQTTIAEEPHIIPGFFNLHILPNSAKELLVPHVLRHWGCDLPALKLIGACGVGNLQEVDRSIIRGSLIYIFTHLDEITNSAYLIDDWGGINGQGQIDDKQEYVFHCLSRLSPFLHFIDPELKQYYLDLASHNQKFLSALSYLDGDESFLSKFFTPQEKRRIILSRDNVSTRLAGINSFFDTYSDEIQAIFAQSQQDFTELRVFRDFKHYLSCKKLPFGYEPESVGIDNLVFIEGLLNYDDRQILSQHLIDRSTFPRFAAHLILAKRLEELGLPKQTAFAWADYASCLYDDPNYFYSLESEARGRVNQANHFIKSHREELLKIIATDTLGVWAEGAPKALDILIGPRTEDIIKAVDSLSHTLNLDEEAHDRLVGLFKLKDLQQGRLARRLIFGKFIDMATTDQGLADINLLLRSSNLSKDDPKRLRAILRLSGMVDLHRILQEETQLKNIHAAVMTRASSFVLSTVDLPQTDHFRVNIEGLHANNLLEAYMSLTDKYTSSNFTRSAEALKLIYRHILEANFEIWRHSRLADDREYDSTRNRAWSTPVNGDTAESYAYTYVDMLKSAQNLTEDARRHLTSFSVDGRPGKRQSGKSIRDKDAKFLFHLFEDIMSARTLTADVARDLATRCNYGAKALQVYGETQSANDLKQVARLASRKINTTRLTTYTSRESGDPVDLVNSGMYPQETCQSWRDGFYNESLVSTVANPRNRIINVVDDQHNICGRALIKWRRFQKRSANSEDGIDEPFEAILVERHYTNKATKASTTLIMSAAIRKAIACNLPLIIADYFLTEEDREVIAKFGGSISTHPILLLSEEIVGDAAYSDTFGGRITTSSDHTSALNIPSPGKVTIITFENDKQN